MMPKRRSNMKKKKKKKRSCSAVDGDDVEDPNENTMYMAADDEDDDDGRPTKKARLDEANSQEPTLGTEHVVAAPVVVHTPPTTFHHPSNNNNDDDDDNSSSSSRTTKNRKASALPPVAYRANRAGTTTTTEASSLEEPTPFNSGRTASSNGDGDGDGGGGIRPSGRGAIRLEQSNPPSPRKQKASPASEEEAAAAAMAGTPVSSIGSKSNDSHISLHSTDQSISEACRDEDMSLQDWSHHHHHHKIPPPPPDDERKRRRREVVLGIFWSALMLMFFSAVVQHPRMEGTKLQRNVDGMVTHGAAKLQTVQKMSQRTVDQLATHGARLKASLGVFPAGGRVASPDGGGATTTTTTTTVAKMTSTVNGLVTRSADFSKRTVDASREAVGRIMPSSSSSWNASFARQPDAALVRWGRGVDSWMRRGAAQLERMRDGMGGGTAAGKHWAAHPVVRRFMPPVGAAAVAMMTVRRRHATIAEFQRAIDDLVTSGVVPLERAHGTMELVRTASGRVWAHVVASLSALAVLVRKRDMTVAEFHRAVDVLVTHCAVPLEDAYDISRRTADDWHRYGAVQIERAQDLSRRTADKLQNYEVVQFLMPSLSAVAMILRLAFALLRRTGDTLVRHGLFHLDQAQGKVKHSEWMVDDLVSYDVEEQLLRALGEIAVVLRDPDMALAQLQKTGGKLHEFSRRSADYLIRHGVTRRLLPSLNGALDGFRRGSMKPSDFERAVDELVSFVAVPFEKGHELSQRTADFGRGIAQRMRPPLNAIVKIIRRRDMTRRELEFAIDELVDLVAVPLEAAQRLSRRTADRSRDVLEGMKPPLRAVSMIVRQRPMTLAEFQMAIDCLVDHGVVVMDTVEGLSERVGRVTDGVAERFEPLWREFAEAVRETAAALQEPPAPPIDRKFGTEPMPSPPRTGDGLVRLGTSSDLPRNVRLGGAAPPGNVPHDALIPPCEEDMLHDLMDKFERLLDEITSHRTKREEMSAELEEAKRASAKLMTELFEAGRADTDTTADNSWCLKHELRIASGRAAEKGQELVSIQETTSRLEYDLEDIHAQLMREMQRSECLPVVLNHHLSARRELAASHQNRLFLERHVSEREHTIAATVLMWVIERRRLARFREQYQSQPTRGEMSAVEAELESLTVLHDETRQRLEDTQSALDHTRTALEQSRTKQSQLSDARLEIDTMTQRQANTQLLLDDTQSMLQTKTAQLEEMWAKELVLKRNLAKVEADLLGTSLELHSRRGNLVDLQGEYAQQGQALRGVERQLESVKSDLVQALLYAQSTNDELAEATAEIEELKNMLSQQEERVAEIVNSVAITTANEQREKMGQVVSYMMSHYASQDTTRPSSSSSSSSPPQQQKRQQ